MFIFFLNDNVVDYFRIPLLCLTI